MNTKAITIVAIAAAVIAAAVAACIVSSNHLSTANAAAKAAAHAEAKAIAAQKTAASDAAKAAAQQRTAEANKKAEADRLAAAKEERAKSESDGKAAEENRKAEEAAARKAKAESERAMAQRETEKAKAAAAADERKKAEAVAATEQAKADAEAERLAIEKTRADKTIAAAKLLELRKLDLESAQQSLSEWQRDLEEREAALKPEKTIADLAWAGGVEDSIIDETGNVVKQVREPYDPEKDMTLPAATRRLKRAERLVREDQENQSRATRGAIVKSLETLYVQALKEHRVIDAEYYRQSLKSLYPDWTFSGDAGESK